MKNKLILLVLSFFALNISAAQTAVDKFPIGRWMVIAEQISYVKAGKVIKEFPTEKIAAEDAYIYNFVYNKTVRVSNINNEFDWKFKLESNKDQLELINVDGEAEDDQLSYSYLKDNLILKRIMEDSDPDDESTVIDVVTTMTLRKL